MLILPSSHRAALEAFARASHPREACGVLIGTLDESGTAPLARVTRILPCRNVDTRRAHDRYELDPADFMDADLGARRDGLEIVGIWHSHPDHPARPSATDHAAAWEGWSYVIASVSAAGVGDVRAWRLAGATFVEEPIRHEEAVRP